MPSAKYCNMPGKHTNLSLERSSPVGDHGAPAVALGEQMSVDALGDRADLIDLKQQAIASLLLHGGENALRVCHGQIVAHNLDVGASGHLGPVLPVILNNRQNTMRSSPSNSSHDS